MSQISLNTGDVRISEVGIDNALPLLSTLINEDGLTTILQIQNVLYNLLRKSSFLLLSDGVITWNGSIIVNNGNNILLKLNQNPTVGVITITMPTAVLSTFPLSNTNILYLQASRSALSASFTATGANFVVSTEGTMPAMASPQADGSNDPTIFVPILARNDIGTNHGALWVPHGIFWPQNTTSVIGSIISATQTPIGAISSVHRFGQSLPLGTPALQVTDPGWALCDGAVINNIQSPYTNPGRNTDGFPNNTYSSGNDNYAPTLNGPPPNFILSTAYVIGDAVSNTGNTKIWTALSNFTSVAAPGDGDPNSANPPTWVSGNTYSPGDFVLFDKTNVNGSTASVSIIYQNLVGNSSTTDPFDQGTAVWQRIWAVEPTDDGNPYRRSGFNSSIYNPPNTYLRSNYISPQTGGAYNSANDKTIAANQLPAHVHTFSTGQPSPNTTGIQSNPNTTTSGGPSAGSNFSVSNAPAAGGIYEFITQLGNGSYGQLQGQPHTHPMPHTHSGTTDNNSTPNNTLNVEPRNFNIVTMIKIY